MKSTRLLKSWHISATCFSIKLYILCNPQVLPASVSATLHVFSIGDIRTDHSGQVPERLYQVGARVVKRIYRFSPTQLFNNCGVRRAPSNYRNFVNHYICGREKTLCKDLAFQEEHQKIRLGERGAVMLGPRAQPGTLARPQIVEVIVDRLF